MRRGVRAGVPAGLATFALAISFGIVARPVVGPVPAIVMSLVVYSGSAQFAALGILAAGGGPLAAAGSGLLSSMRYLPMGIASASALRSGRLRRACESQALVDASWAMAQDGTGRFDRGILLGSSLPQALGWWSGTVVGTLAGRALGSPQSLGLDAVFPAFFLYILVGAVRDRQGLAVALAGGGIALALVPVLPVGLPVMCASAAALAGLRTARPSA